MRQLPYLPITSARPIGTYQHIFISETIPIHSRWIKLLLKSNVALTLYTYHISQTDQNLSTHLHQPDYTNLFQMKKLLLKSNIALTLSTYHISQTDQNLSTHLHHSDNTNPFHLKKTSSEKQYSPYPIYLSYQLDWSVSHQPDRSEPIYTSSSARLYKSIPDETTPSEKYYSPYPSYLSHQPDRSEPINTYLSARLYQSIPDE